MNTPEQDAYTKMSLQIKFKDRDLQNFEKTIKNWEDTPKNAVSQKTIRVNHITYTQVRQETLPDGTKVYNTAQGYFKLGTSGIPDGKKMTPEELAKHGVKTEA